MKVNAVDSQDVYLISTWGTRPRLDPDRCVRHRPVEFDSEDDYLPTARTTAAACVTAKPIRHLAELSMGNAALSPMPHWGKVENTDLSGHWPYQPQGSGLNFGLTPRQNHAGRNAVIKLQTERTRIDCGALRAG